MSQRTTLQALRLLRKEVANCENTAALFDSLTARGRRLLSYTLESLAASAAIYCAYLRLRINLRRGDCGHEKAWKIAREIGTKVSLMIFEEIGERV